MIKRGYDRLSHRRVARRERLPGVAGTAPAPRRPALPRAIAIPADAIARAIVFAIEQPDNVDVSEMIVQPTGER
jgi:NADP-dependent 3-hydroxy acid dehydrogenase YdfG